ncbi:MAG: peptidylprolyl isomerase [Gammaproteobacteria bacterium]|nr:peptidylprolyl isomerase [Gammaproteobacteria bacterium]NND39406.1 peptidylprolyl isomerase [Pseudomonadales bacterium]MBT8150320.1 peptidylprolyl isomerase [Gammaproteobacteria bacterium]NNL10952.1 peptidylprolyl isomerase [Pseudomonadales bacterium]NNM10603.1 peptidylprolyl isomerase [Pseudomonadales bacterium]
MLVSENSILLLNFALTLGDGEVIDSNLDGEPLRYEMGGGDMLPGFERVLIGMQAGEKKSVVLPPEQAFGLSNQENLQRMPRSSFGNDIPLEVGIMLAFGDAAGTETPGVVAGVNEEYVEVDFNHPLAGRDIGFTAHVHDVLQ